MGVTEQLRRQFSRGQKYNFVQETWTLISQTEEKKQLNAKIFLLVSSS